MVIQELNQLLMFDGEGNILRVTTVNFGGTGDGVIILKNGVNDPELMSQANKEFDGQRLEMLKENFPQLALGVMEALAGLGITGLYLAGTYFSGGTLALTGISQAGAVAGTAMTGAGALTVADAISKMGVASSMVSFSFANNYSDRQNNLRPNGTFENAPYHTNYGNSVKSKRPKDGQTDYSVLKIPSILYQIPVVHQKIPT